MSGHDMVCFDKTFEAAEALLHMESPGGMHSERSTGKQADEWQNLCHTKHYMCDLYLKDSVQLLSKQSDLIYYCLSFPDLFYNSIGFTFIFRGRVYPKVINIFLLVYIIIVHPH